MKIISYLDLYIYFIIIIKILFLLMAIGNIITSHSHKFIIQEKNPYFVYWKNKFEFIFVISMAALMIYYFKPGQNIVINKQSRFLFFLFGFILLFTAQWNAFISEANWFITLKNIFGLNATL